MGLNLELDREKMVRRKRAGLSSDTIHTIQSISAERPDSAETGNLAQDGCRTLSLADESSFRCTRYAVWNGNHRLASIRAGGHRQDDRLQQ